MRMNVNSSTTAFQVVNEYDEQNLIRILVSYGEFKRGEAKKIFRKIDENRSIKSIKTTKDLQGILDPIFPTRFLNKNCLLYTSPSPRDNTLSRMPSSA